MAARSTSEIVGTTKDDVARSDQEGARLRVGVAHHFGWAAVVTAGPDHHVVDRRRIELVEPGFPTAPIHHEGASLDDHALSELVAEARASAQRATTSALAELARSVAGAIESVSLRGWPADFPSDIRTQRRPPYEARADSVMYRQVLADCAEALGWGVHRFDARTVEARATETLGDRAHDVLRGPRQYLGPPWTKDHRTALAATVVAGAIS